VPDVYEGLTSGQYEDWEPEYDVDDVEEESEASLVFQPLSGYDLYIIDKYGPDISVNTDEDAGYGPNSYFARSMITE